MDSYFIRKMSPIVYYTGNRDTALVSIKKYFGSFIEIHDLRDFIEGVVNVIQYHSELDLNRATYVVIDSETWDEEIELLKEFAMCDYSKLKSLAKSVFVTRKQISFNLDEAL